MDIVTLVLFVIGLVILIVGAEALVRGASKLALGIGISPLVVGLTVVAFGTSAPELAVSTISSWSGEADLAIGNVVGSNIFNVLFILGLSALITPLAVQSQLIRFDVPLMILISLLLWGFAADGRISQIEGLFLFAGIITYTIFLVTQSRKEQKLVAEKSEMPAHPVDNSARAWLINIGYIAVGLTLLVLGSRWLVNGAVMIAQTFGVSELVIGLTIIAVGTSLPEVATSIVAAMRGERDIAVGNVVGSNIFNILCVLGLSSAVSPNGINVAEEAIRFDIPVMVAVALVCLPIFFSGREIARWEGLLFLGYYAAYTTYLILSAEPGVAIESFSQAMVVALPVSLGIVLFSALRSWQRRGTVTAMR